MDKSQHIWFLFWRAQSFLECQLSWEGKRSSFFNMTRKKGSVSRYKKFSKHKRQGTAGARQSDPLRQRKKKKPRKNVVNQSISSTIWSRNSIFDMLLHITTCKWMQLKALALDAREAYDKWVATTSKSTEKRKIEQINWSLNCSKMMRFWRLCENCEASYASVDNFI